MRYSSVSQRFENYFNLIIIVSFLSDIGGKKNTIKQIDWNFVKKKKKYAAIFTNIYGHTFYGLSKINQNGFSQNMVFFFFLTTINLSNHIENLYILCTLVNIKSLKVGSKVHQFLFNSLCVRCRKVGTPYQDNWDQV